MKRFGIFVAVVMLMTLSMYGQDGYSADSIRQLLAAMSEPQYAGKLVLSIKDAQDYAVQQNRTLQNASLEVKKAHAQRWQTIASILPQVDASAQYINMCKYEMEFGASKSSGTEMTPAQKMEVAQFMGTYPYIGGMLLSSSSGQKITMPDYVTAGGSASMGLNGQAIVGILINNIAIQMQDISRDQSESNLRANVVESYMAVLVMEDIVQLMDSSLQNVRKLASQTQRMAEVGTVEQTQADQIQVRVNQLSNSLAANKRSLILAYNALRVLLDVPAETELQLTNTLDELLNVENTLGVLLENFNINNNYDYQLLQKNVELAKKNVSMAAWAYGPTVGATYQYTYRYNIQEGGFNMTPPNMVAVSFSMPLWSSGKRAAGVTEKKIALQEAQNTLAETRDNLGIRYQQLRYNLANAYETYMTEKENLDVTQRVMDQITNKYNWGAASSLELTNASNDLINAQSTYVNAVLTLVNAEVELDKFLNNK